MSLSPSQPGCCCVSESQESSFRNEQSDFWIDCRGPPPATGDDHQLCGRSGRFVTFPDKVRMTAGRPKVLLTTAPPIRAAFQFVIWHKEILWADSGAVSVSNVDWKKSSAPPLANAATQPTSGASRGCAGVEPASIFGNRPNFSIGALTARIIATRRSEGNYRRGITCYRTARCPTQVRGALATRNSLDVSVRYDNRWWAGSPAANLRAQPESRIQAQRTLDL